MVIVIFSKYRATRQIQQIPIIPNLQIRYLSKHSAISEGDIDVPAVIRNHIQFSPLCREMFGWYWNIAMW